MATLLSDLVSLERRPVEVDPSEEYGEIGIYSFGRGIFHKPPKKGFEVGKKPLYSIKEGDLIFQITFSWEGAIALADHQDEGMCASIRFPTFRVDENVCDACYLLLYLLTEEGLTQIVRISPGSAGRNRVLSVRRFREVSIPVLPLGLQKWLVSNVQTSMNELKSLRDEIEKGLDKLAPSIIARSLTVDCVDN